jgi:hypothetical protein
MTLSTITLGEAVLTIDFAIENVINDIHLNDSTIEEITYSVNNHKWIRDYLIGLPVQHGLDKSIDFVNYLSRMTNAEDSFAYDTLLAMYYYEKENKEMVNAYIKSATKSNPNYELLALIKRVVSAEWPSNSFAEMRSQLAPQVVKDIHANKDEVIE